MRIEQFFQPVLVAPTAALKPWRDYVIERYPWVLSGIQG